ncbi:MAG: dihydrofolate reductase family protein [Spirochaetia bacterium]|nr:dihydrofolate reductase family protein [Spirochaetia bacterium]
MQVWLNMAMSLDGSTSSGGKWSGLSSPRDRQKMDELRAECDGLLIGARTIAVDNPNVNVKASPEKSPVPITICRSTILDPALRFFQGPRKPIVFTSKEPETRSNAEWIVTDSSKLTPVEIVQELSKRKVSRLLLEGGPTLARAFLNANLIDRMYLTIVPWVLFEHNASERIEPRNFKLTSVEQFDQEIFLQYDR